MLAGSGPGGSAARQFATGPADRAVAVRGMGEVWISRLHGSCPHPANAIGLPGTLAGQTEGAAELFFGGEARNGFIDPLLAVSTGIALVNTVPATLTGRSMEGRHFHEVVGLTHRRSPPGRRLSCPAPGPCGCGGG